MESEIRISSDEAGTRQKIIDAARHEFAEYGLAGARVERIAKRAGVNKAMIYYHFSSKDLLYEGVVKNFFQVVFTQLNARTLPGTSLEEMLLAILDTHISVFLHQPEFFHIFVREMASSDQRAIGWITDAIKASGLPNQAIETIGQGAKAGVLRQVDPRQSFVSLITMSMGYMMLAPLVDRVWGIEDRAVFIEERKHAIVDLFLNGVLAR
jgi:TetR/AcrR family transcriptional regulator